MLVKQLIRETLELQGFRIESVEKKDSGLLVTIQADLRYHPRCGACGASGDYRDTLSERRFRHVPIWGVDVTLTYTPCRVSCSECGGIHVELMQGTPGRTPPEVPSWSAGSGPLPGILLQRSSR